MIHQFSKMIADFLLHRKVISEEEIDIYIYGYETMILGLIDFLIIIFMGLVFDRIITMLIFFTMFVSIRIYTGGYHANTVLKCKIVFVSICVLVLFLSEIRFPYFFYILVMLLYLLSSYFLAPVSNVNKPLTNDEQMKYRRISIALAVIWCAIAFFSYFFAIKICTTITITAFFISLLMIIGKYGKEEKVHEE